MFERTARRALVLSLLAGCVALPALAEAQSWRTLRSSRQVWDREPLNVQIRYAAGELTVTPAEQPLLYQMELRYDEDRFRPLTSLDPERHTLRLGIDTVEGVRGGDIDDGSRAEIALTREVPLDLDLEFGAGRAELNLSGMRLRGLSVSTGASETTIRFAALNPIEADELRIQAGAAQLEVIGIGNSRARSVEFHGGVGSTVLDFTGTQTEDTDVSVKMGIGEMKLRFPRGVGVQLQRRSFLTSFETEGLVRRGDAFYSPDWDTAARRITVEVEAALGSVEVEWVG